MSDLLRRLAAHVRTVPADGVHIVSGQDWSDDSSSLEAAEPAMRSAEPVEGSMDARSVGSAESGCVRFFMDGIERRHIPLYYSMVPVVYGYVAAVIRERGADRRMGTYEQAAIDEALYLPYKYVDTEYFSRAGVRIVDTGDGDKAPEEHPIMLREAARVKISNRRGILEKDLAGKWLAAFDGGDDWLLVDGSLGGPLGGDYSSYSAPNIIGVVKSHQTQYFPMNEQRKILALRVGERSGVFRPLARQDQAPVFSWYLRLRPNDGQDVYFGLIRIEAAANQCTLDMADEISRWLLAERCPLSLPDSRWDKMFYPVRDCEQYLRSLAPTRTMLEASMMGLGLPGTGG